MACGNVQRGRRCGKTGVEGTLVHVDANADDGVSHAGIFKLGLDEDAAGFAFAEQQVVGPPQVDSKAARGVDRFSGSEARSQRQQREATCRNRWAQQHADVEALSCGGVPGVVAASPARALFVSKVNGAVRRAGPRGFKRDSVCGTGDSEEVQVACEDSSCERGFKHVEVVHGQAGSATMLMEISAAPADWVSAPKLMKSTPVSA